MKRNRWLIFWLLGMTLDAGTTLIGQIQSRRYEQNGVVNVVGFKMTYLLMAALARVNGPEAKQAQQEVRRTLLVNYPTSSEARSFLSS